MGEAADDAVDAMVDFLTRKDNGEWDHEDEYPTGRRSTRLPKPTTAQQDFAELGSTDLAYDSEIRNASRSTGLNKRVVHERTPSRSTGLNKRSPHPPKDYGSPDYEKEVSITELAECVKDLIRIMKLEFRVKDGSPLDRRLNDIYKKASRAKDRMDV